MKNLERPKVPSADERHFFWTRSGCQLFIYDYQPIENYNSTIFIISGITGINHIAEKEIIEQLVSGNYKCIF